MNNPLDAYRRTQRELRRHFDAFTKENCPTCPTPCCRRPARILPTDILLAEATGWRANLIPLEPTAPPTDEIAEIAGRMATALTTTPESEEEETEGLPCEYLGERGCTFPTDLRPFGCTTFLCRYMYERLDRQSLSRLKRLTRELEERHTVLLRTLRPVKWEE